MACISDASCMSGQSCCADACGVSFCADISNDDHVRVVGLDGPPGPEGPPVSPYDIF